MHMLRIIKVLQMRGKLYRLRRAKRIALEMSRNRSPYISYLDKFDYWNAKYLHCGCIKSLIRTNRNKAFMQRLFKIYIIMTTSGTFPNYIVTAILGFLGAVLLTYIYFLVSVFLDMPTHVIFWTSVFSCIFLTLGMTFYSGVRCVVLSVIPEACTSRAQAIIISLALIALLLGPGSNILSNAKELSRTISCTQEQVENLAKNLTELYKQPQAAIQKGIFGFLREIKPYTDLLRKILRYTVKILKLTRKISKKSRSWMKFMFLLNNFMPSNFCTDTLLVWLKECESMMGDLLSGICNPYGIITSICLPLGVNNEMASLRKFIEHRVVDFLKNKIKQLEETIKSIFYVKISFHRSFSFETNQSRSLKDVYKELFQSREQQVKAILTILHWIKYIPTMYIIHILIVAFIYRYRFFNNPRFDNHHINKFIIELDTKRSMANKQTLFPLTEDEKSRYVSLLSYRLTASDRRAFIRNSIFFVVATLKTSFVFIIDYFLFLVLDLIHRKGRFSFHFERDETIIGAEGSGFFHTLYNIFNSFTNSVDYELHFDSSYCLPQPIPIDIHAYIKIATLLGLAGIITLFQPFALRFRNFVLSYYYPETARRRSVWLYNNILQSRGVMSQYIRQTLFTKGSLGVRSEKPSLLRWLVANFPLLHYIFPTRKLDKICMVCGYENPNVRCATPDCPGIYDKECFESLNNTCMICNMQQDFKGLDISEEEDSEGELDVATPQTNLTKPWWKFWIQVTRIDSMMEERIISKPDQTTTAPSSSDLQPSKDYFSDQWRRDDWATLDDYDIPVRGKHSKKPSHFTTEIPPSPKIQ